MVISKCCKDILYKCLSDKTMFFNSCFFKWLCVFGLYHLTYERQHEISNNVVCATSKASDQPTHTHSLIRVFASCMSILCLLSY